MRRPVYEVFAPIAHGRPSNPTLWNETRHAPVSSLCYDSRLATAGTVFFCLVGKVSDGHSYARSAYRNGCRLFVAKRLPDVPEDAVVWLVEDPRAALADCAAAFYGHPEREMRLIGLTGTKGKTTTALLIQSLLNRAEIPTGYIGTNGIDYGGRHFETPNSTPESLEIYRHLRAMLDEGMRTCVLEVSSQGLWMGRTRGLIFDSVLFLNLSRDHIGGVEHPSMEHYRDSKKRLFTEYPARVLIARADDPSTPYMLDGVSTPMQSFSTRSPDADWYAFDIHPLQKEGRPGTIFSVSLPEGGGTETFFLPLPGEYNLQNALAALAVVCGRFKVDPQLAASLLTTASVTGRFQAITSSTLPGVTFVIDYAHNGVSLAAVLDTLRSYKPKRLICLFGSVGGRTLERRRDLAEAAAYRADLCILTADNPADEPVLDIIREIDAYFPPDGCPRLWEPDREVALRHLVDTAEEGDVILLAGKGHETYQLIGSERIPFSESEILAKALRERALATMV